MSARLEPSGPPAPTGRTARRLTWEFLPPHLRREIEARCGSPVVGATSQDGGFTPGFASVLTCADGSRHFVKAASVTAQRVFAQSYREEARKLRALPREVPAPRLRWVLDEEWVVLGIEHVEAALPERPWSPADLDALLDALEVVADVLTPPPPGLTLDDAADDLADWPAMWDLVPTGWPDLPAERVAEAAALARRLPEVLAAEAGDTVAHTDVRDDNTLVRPDGSVLLCDWNWPVRGPAWLDTLMALVGPRGDGLDVDAVLASRRLTRDVDPDHLDVVLAALTGYFLRHGVERVPPSSPWIRAHQAWQGEVCWDWLAQRRGWS